MSKPRLQMVFLGLSITSSWGNGHATTYRALVRELSRRGHRVLFLERDVPWYAENRDLPRPPYGHTELYSSVEDLMRRFERPVRQADLVVVGSYVPDGIAVGDWVLAMARGTTAFYDIDTPVTLADLGKGTCSYLERCQVPRYGLYLSFTGGPTLKRIEQELGASSAHALYCSCDPESHTPRDVPRVWDVGYLGTYSPDRQPTLDRLLLDAARTWPQGTFVVAGPQYPEEVVWPGNVQRIAHLAPPEHSAFYAAQRFALNVTRGEMARAGWSPSIRLFEAAACGVPIISDRWPGLDEFFEPGREILISGSGEETLSYLRGMSESERGAMGERARLRVLASHTAVHRAMQLEQWMQGQGGGA